MLEATMDANTIGKGDAVNEGGVVEVIVAVTTV